MTERKKRNAMKRMKRSEMPMKQAECQTAKRLHREAVVRKEVLLMFDTLLANFRSSKFCNIIGSPLGIEAEILRRRLQCKARLEGERQENLNCIKYFILSARQLKLTEEMNNKTKEETSLLYKKRN